MTGQSNMHVNCGHVTPTLLASFSTPTYEHYKLMSVSLVLIFLWVKVLGCAHKHLFLFNISP